MSAHATGRRSHSLLTSFPKVVGLLDVTAYSTRIPPLSSHIPMWNGHKVWVWICGVLLLPAGGLLQVFWFDVGNE